jgi:hypothetical protein
MILGYDSWLDLIETTLLIIISMLAGYFIRYFKEKEEGEKQ